MSVCGQEALTSLVLQMSPSVDPQAFPGVAFQGIIPVAMNFKGFHTHSNSVYYVNNDQTCLLLRGVWKVLGMSVREGLMKDSNLFALWEMQESGL